MLKMTFDCTCGVIVEACVFPVFCSCGKRYDIYDILSAIYRALERNPEQLSPATAARVKFVDGTMPDA